MDGGGISDQPVIIALQPVAQARGERVAFWGRLGFGFGRGGTFGWWDLVNLWSFVVFLVGSKWFC